MARPAARPPIGSSSAVRSRQGCSDTTPKTGGLCRKKGKRSVIIESFRGPVRRAGPFEGLATGTGSQSTRSSYPGGGTASRRFSRMRARAAKHAWSPLSKQLHVAGRTA